MGLHGQGWRRPKWSSERGYAMAALLIALAIMAILMSVAMPVWRQEARREKEAELVFRGEQYARAIALYNYKNGQAANAFPPSIQVLVDGRYLRKKYKDPMTKDGEFMIMPLGAATPGMPGGGAPTPGMPGSGSPTQPGARGTGSPAQAGGRLTPPQSQQPSTFSGQPQVAGGGGIIGVRSKSQENSLRSYRGQTRYDQWLFVYSNAARPGGAPRGNPPDGRGNQPGLNQGPRGTTPGFNNPGFNPGGFRIPGRGDAPGGSPSGSGGRRGSAPGGRGPG
ncbi:MAG TPA: hypothetical protein VFJ02_05945 [Vicinamibacterales bacterium]|nr:hypothetical protein [Vicinamibacterales bacterium]